MYKIHVHVRTYTIPWNTCALWDKPDLKEAVRSQSLPVLWHVVPLLLTHFPVHTSTGFNLQGLQEGRQYSTNVGLIKAAFTWNIFKNTRYECFGNRFVVIMFIWKLSELIKMAIASAAWTDDEAELLLNVRLEYKTTKVFEGLDWEGIRSKYAGILERFRDPSIRICRLHNIVSITISNISTTWNVFVYP